MFDYKELGAGIKYYRKKNKLTAEQFSEKLNITPKHLSKLENGSTPSTLLLLDICNIFNLGIRDLIEHKKDDENILYRQFKSEVSSFSYENKNLLCDIMECISALNSED